MEVEDDCMALPPLPVEPKTPPPKGPPQTQLTLIQSEPSKTCPHGLVRYLEPCGRCWEQLQLDAFGWVQDSKYDMNVRIGKLCVHGVERRRCKVCVGCRICCHGKEKWYCSTCDGGKLCIMCRRHTVAWVGTTCKTCKAREEGRPIKNGRPVKVPKPKKPKGPPRRPAGGKAEEERQDRERRRLAGETVSTPGDFEADSVPGDADADSVPSTPSSGASEGEKDSGI